MSAIIIRSAFSNDAAALREIYRRSSLSNEGDRPLFTRHPELLEWKDGAIRDGRTRVALIGGQVVGFATIAVKDGLAEVEDLFVDPAWMHQGVGRALLEDLMVTASARGLDHVEVDANPHSLTFYRSVGFSDLGEVNVEYGTGMRMGRSTTL